MMNLRRTRWTVLPVVVALALDVTGSRAGADYQVPASQLESCDAARLHAAPATDAEWRQAIGGGFHPDHLRVKFVGDKGEPVTWKLEEEPRWAADSLLVRDPDADEDRRAEPTAIAWPNLMLVERRTGRSPWPGVAIGAAAGFAVGMIALDSDGGNFGPSDEAAWGFITAIIAGPVLGGILYWRWDRWVPVVCNPQSAGVGESPRAH